MPSKTTSSRHPLNFLEKSDERNPFVAWAGSGQGWLKLAAFNPSAVYILRPEEFIPEKSMAEFFKFCREHSGKLIAGYVSYDLGRLLMDIAPGPKDDDLELPLIHFHVYDNFSVLEDNSLDPLCQFASRTNSVSGTNNDGDLSTFFKKHSRSNFRLKLKRDDYRKNFEKIQNYIRAGDIYQINYTHRLEAETSMSGRELFLRFVDLNPVSHAAYLEGDDFSIISASPECFIKTKGKNIVAKPIKGTRPRGRDIAEDRLLAKDLLSSAKEQAELFMIVDLLRNDLGKVCQIGSVKVKENKKLQHLPHLLHTMAEIEGTLREDIDGVQALISMFPGGSITGCPKKRAMEIIDELESVPRGVYTGSVGYILPNRDVEFNIAIRTVIKKKNRLCLGVGGGITIDSRAEDEYNETLIKAQSFLKFNET